MALEHVPHPPPLLRPTASGGPECWGVLLFPTPRDGARISGRCSATIFGTHKVCVLLVADRTNGGSFDYYLNAKTAPFQESLELAQHRRLSSLGNSSKLQHDRLRPISRKRTARFSAPGALSSPEPFAIRSAVTQCPRRQSARGLRTRQGACPARWTWSCGGIIEGARSIVRDS